MKGKMHIKEKGDSDKIINFGNGKRKPDMKKIKKKKERRKTK